MLRKVKEVIPMISSLPPQFWFSFLILLIFTAAIPVYGQGGPPMITDDPFTPENGHWENNFAIQYTETASSKEIDAPAVDINYGYGDHVQLKIEMPIMKYLFNDDGSLIGGGNVKIGIKARFLDEKQNGFAVSTYPQYEFNNSSIGEKGEAPQFFLPLEVGKTVGRFHYAAEVGYSFLASAPDELAYGIVAGYDQSEQCELLVEVHGENQYHVGPAEIIFNLGLTYRLGPSLEFLASAGTTVYSPEPSNKYVAYLGIRWML